MTDEAPAAPAGADEISATLSKPLRVFDKELTKLVFREPTAEDIERYGFPLILDDSADDPMTADPTKPKAPDIRFDAKSMTAHIAVLSGTPIVNIRKLSAGDWLRCAYKVSVFFLR